MIPFLSQNHKGGRAVLRTTDNRPLHIRIDITVYHIQTAFTSDNLPLFAVSRIPKDKNMGN